MSNNITYRHFFDDISKASIKEAAMDVPPPPPATMVRRADHPSIGLSKPTLHKASGFGDKFNKQSKIQDYYKNKSTGKLSENETFIEILQKLENNKGQFGKDKGGYIEATDSWKPIKDPSKGIVIGYGHVIPEKYFNSGLTITDQQAVLNLKNDIKKAEEIVITAIENYIKNGEIKPNNNNNNNKLVLTDAKLAPMIIIAFKGSYDYPKLANALLNNDLETALKEANISYTDRTGERKVLKTRTNAIKALIQSALSK